MPRSGARVPRARRATGSPKDVRRRSETRRASGTGSVPPRCGAPVSQSGRLAWSAGPEPTERLKNGHARVARREGAQVGEPAWPGADAHQVGAFRGECEQAVGLRRAQPSVVFGCKVVGDANQRVSVSEAAETLTTAGAMVGRVPMAVEAGDQVSRPGSGRPRRRRHVEIVGLFSIAAHTTSAASTPWRSSSYKELLDAAAAILVGYERRIRPARRQAWQWLSSSKEWGSSVRPFGSTGRTLPVSRRSDCIGSIAPAQLSIGARSAPVRSGCRRACEDGSAVSAISSSPAARPSSYFGWADRGGRGESIAAN